jgi:hypothetical protein
LDTGQPALKRHSWGSAGQRMHGLFRGREFGVGPELISRVPQAGSNLRDVMEGVGGHLGGLACWFWRLASGVFGLCVQRGYG